MRQQIVILYITVVLNFYRTNVMAVPFLYGNFNMGSPAANREKKEVTRNFNSVASFQENRHDFANAYDIWKRKQQINSNSSPKLEESGETKTRPIYKYYNVDSKGSSYITNREDKPKWSTSKVSTTGVNFHNEPVWDQQSIPDRISSMSKQDLQQVLYFLMRNNNNNNNHYDNQSPLSLSPTFRSRVSSRQWSDQLVSPNFEYRFDAKSPKKRNAMRNDQHQYRYDQMFANDFVDPASFPGAGDTIYYYYYEEPLNDNTIMSMGRDNNVNNVDFDDSRMMNILPQQNRHQMKPTIDHKSDSYYKIKNSKGKSKYKMHHKNKASVSKFTKDYPKSESEFLPQIKVKPLNYVKEEQAINTTINKDNNNFTESKIPVYTPKVVTKTSESHVLRDFKNQVSDYNGIKPGIIPFRSAVSDLAANSTYHNEKDSSSVTTQIDQKTPLSTNVSIPTDKSDLTLTSLLNTSAIPKQEVLNISYSIGVGQDRETVNIEFMRSVKQNIQDGNNHSLTNHSIHTSTFSQEVTKNLNDNFTETRFNKSITLVDNVNTSNKNEVFDNNGRINDRMSLKEKNGITASGKRSDHRLETKITDQIYKDFNINTPDNHTFHIMNKSLSMANAENNLLKIEKITKDEIKLSTLNMTIQENASIKFHKEIDTENKSHSRFNATDLMPLNLPEKIYEQENNLDKTSSTTNSDGVTMIIEGFQNKNSSTNYFEVGSKSLENASSEDQENMTNIISTIDKDIHKNIKVNYSTIKVDVTVLTTNDTMTFEEIELAKHFNALKGANPDEITKTTGIGTTNKSNIYRKKNMNQEDKNRTSPVSGNHKMFDVVNDVGKHTNSNEINTLNPVDDLINAPDNNNDLNIDIVSSNHNTIIVKGLQTDENRNKSFDDIQINNKRGDNKNNVSNDEQDGALTTSEYAQNFSQISKHNVANKQDNNTDVLLSNVSDTKSDNGLNSGLISPKKLERANKIVSSMSLKHDSSVASLEQTSQRFIPNADNSSFDQHANSNGFQLSNISKDYNIAPTNTTTKSQPQNKMDLNTSASNLIDNFESKLANNASKRSSNSTSTKIENKNPFPSTNLSKNVTLSSHNVSLPSTSNDIYRTNHTIPSTSSKTYPTNKTNSSIPASDIPQSISVQNTNNHQPISIQQRQPPQKLTLADFPSLLMRQRHNVDDLTNVKTEAKITTLQEPKLLLIERTTRDVSTVKRRPEEEKFHAVPKITAYRSQDFSLRKPEQWQLDYEEAPQKFETGPQTGTAEEQNAHQQETRASNTSSSEILEMTDSLIDKPAIVQARAAVSAVLTSHFGPTKQQIIPFDLELLDLADNYDNNTGMFIATIPGTYVISVHLMSHPGAKVNARVYVNDRPVAALWADDNKHAGFYPSSSIQTVAQLGFGDQVYVMLIDGGYGDSWVHANYNAFTVFLLYQQTFF